MNVYEKAIEKNEVIPFFRDQGEYFDLDSEFNEHNKAFTVAHIFAYRLVASEQILFERLEKDILIFLQLDDFNYSDLILILTILWRYFQMKNDENKIAEKWEFSKEIKAFLKQKYNELDMSENEKANIERIISNMEERYNFNLFSNV